MTRTMRLVPLISGFLLVLTVGCFAPSGPTEGGPSLRPARVVKRPHAGIFGMVGPRTPLERGLEAYDRAFAACPELRGVLVLVEWATVQPHPCRPPDWSIVDAYVELARRHDRQVALCVASTRPPAWIFGNGRVKRFAIIDPNPLHPEHGQPRDVGVPVDDGFLPLWGRLVAAAGERYDPNPTVTAVVAMGVNFYGPETKLIFPTGAEQAQAAELDLSHENVLAWWKRYLALYAECWPNTTIKLHGAKMGPELPRTLDELVEWAAETYPGRFAIQCNKLNGRDDNEHLAEYRLVSRYAGRIQTGFQAVSSVRNTRRMGAVVQMIANLVRARARYLELWFGDATDVATIERVAELWNGEKARSEKGIRRLRR